jgi:hypothetical protein
MGRGIKPSLDADIQAILDQRRDEFRKLVADGDNPKVLDEFKNKTVADIADVHQNLTREELKVCFRQ